MHIILKFILSSVVIILLMCLMIGNVYSRSSFDNDPTWIIEANKKNTQLETADAKHENRVMFDEDIWWALDKSNTDTIIDRLASAGFNVYIPCVWHGKGTYYPTEFAHQDERIKKRISTGDDPLKYLIEKAHSKNIEVHIWYTVVRREDDEFKEYFDEGTPKNAYNVQNEKFRDFIITLMLDAVKRYDIDGINLDYIRSMGYCRSTECANNYKKLFNRDLSIDLLKEKVPKSRIKSIEKWNEAPIEEIVYKTSSESKKLDLTS